MSRARTHEDTPSHTRLARNLDRAQPEDPVLVPIESSGFAGDIDYAPAGTTPSPDRPQSESPGLLRPDQSSIHGPALPEDDEDQIYDNFSGDLAFNRPGFDLEDDSTSDSDEDDADVWEESPASRRPCYGPILELAEAEFENSPANNSNLCLSSDDLNLPESDGLLMDHDKQFDETQECTSFQKKI